MGEIAKCPRCGETPKRIQYKAGGFGHSCCGAEFFCTTYWNQYAAAMELARSTVKRKAAHDYVREAWKVSDEVSDLAREALEDADGEVKDATKRVIKVFGGE